MKLRRKGNVRRRPATRLFRTEVLEPRIVLSAVPAFESLPGANHTIFLDFDGHTVTNTHWNSYYNQSTLVAKPYDIDGNSGSFNSTELARIQEAWMRVAEDFRPFNVNVTTIEPSTDKLIRSGSGDSQWGVRVLVTNESTMVTDPASRSGAGGIAYIDSFNWSSDTPAWVFTTGGKSIAEAASHEVGHALGLSHDGTASTGYYRGHGDGDIGWASIMGVGYYENVTQWDDGTYYGSNNAGSDANYGKGPDDLAIITSYNGFGYRADDHGNTSGTASPLGTSGSTVVDGGLIEKSTDVDVFSFNTGAGNISLSVTPFTPGPNLDVLARLYDAAGSLIASSNPTTTLGAAINATVTAGQYFLHIDGVGVGDPTSSSPTGYTDYASIGSYTISGSLIEAAATPQLTISNATVNEQDGTARLAVTLSGTLASTATVTYGTSNGSALAGSDYTATSSTLTFQPGGPTTQYIDVTILDDSTTESTETFSVNLSGASGAIIADGTGVVTINDDDVSVTPVTISISDASVNEGDPAKGKKNSGTSTRNLTFTVTLSSPATQTVTVDYTTVDGSATAGSDYLTKSGTLTFTPGQTSQSVDVEVIRDSATEGDEAFTVELSSASNATIANGTGTGTILGDDTSGGGGKGKPNRIAGDPILIADPMWYFEAPDGRELDGRELADHDHHHDHHDHDHDHFEVDQHHRVLTPTSPLNLASTQAEQGLSTATARVAGQNDVAAQHSIAADRLMQLLALDDTPTGDQLEPGDWVTSTAADDAADGQALELALAADDWWA